MEQDTSHAAKEAVFEQYEAEEDILLFLQPLTSGAEPFSLEEIHRHNRVESGDDHLFCLCEIQELPEDFPWILSAPLTSGRQSEIRFWYINSRLKVYLFVAQRVGVHS